MLLEVDETRRVALRYSSLEIGDYAGDVYKRGKKTKMKQPRYLHLSYHHLQVMKRKATPAIAEIDMRECSADQISGELGAFIITAADKEWVFFAPSQKERDAWLHQLGLASRAISQYYHLGKTVGRGSFAEVVLASDRKTNEVFAVKIVAKPTDTKEEHLKQRETLRREIAILATVDHPNVVRTVDVFQTKAHVYLVMEFMGGGELFDVIAEEKTFTEQNASQVMREILLGVAYLHSCGIVHRDIKPENILCVKKTWPLQVKVCDFGLANMFEAGTGDVLHSLVGTCVYRAPEMLRNVGHGPAVDLWACGVIMYVMLFGLFPFYGVTDQEYLDEIDMGLQYPSGMSESVSPECAHVLEGLLNVNPALRLTANDALRQAWFNPALQSHTRSKNLDKVARGRIHSARRSDLSSILGSPRSSCSGDPTTENSS